ncbi:DGQHR domain-containing protein [Vibrio parahaemolyticus]|nr:DGQHR domain-containing protein [Vibrio parahaemolyticus]EJG0302306.1 DGQHR domain-containing protein [Vibrio parahaemolyticus]
MSNVFPSLRGAFGTWVYYPVLFSPKQVDELISTSKEIREAASLDDYLQRELTPNVGRILEYLKVEEDRFFNSIIVGVFDGVPDWLSLNLSGIDDLEEDQKKVLDDSIGILKFNGDEKLFAIDGQHRAEAIKKRYNEDNTYDDQISVIFVAHSDSDVGKKRTRKLFSDLNKTAQKVSPGELAIIDEQDIENIVARKIYSEYPRIPSSVISLSKSAPIRASESEFFTNLLTLVKICKIISKSMFKRRKYKYTDDDVNELYEKVCDFLDLILDSDDEIENSFGNSDSTQDLRSNHHALFRPIGWEIAAEVYKYAIIEDKVNDFESGLDSVDWNLNSVAFKDIIYVRNKVVTKDKKYSIALLKYILLSVDIDENDIPDNFVSEAVSDLLS